MREKDEGKGRIEKLRKMKWVAKIFRYSVKVEG